MVETAKATGCRLTSMPQRLHSIRVRYGLMVAKGSPANPAPELGKRSGYERKAFNLLVRLDTQRADVLRFASTSVPLRQQPGRAGHQDGEAPTEDLRFLAHTGRGPQLLRHPQLRLDPAQAGPQRARWTTSAVRGSGLAARWGLNSYESVCSCAKGKRVRSRAGGSTSPPNLSLRFV